MVARPAIAKVNPMYSPTAATPAAAPRQASYMRAALYHYAPAPYMRRRNAKAKSLAAMLAARGTGPVAAKAFIARQHARALAGLPICWPS